MCTGKSMLAFPLMKNKMFHVRSMVGFLPSPLPHTPADEIHPSKPLYCIVNYHWNESYIYIIISNDFFKYYDICMIYETLNNLLITNCYRYNIKKNQKRLFIIRIWFHTSVIFLKFLVFKYDYVLPTSEISGGKIVSNEVWQSHC